MIRVTNILKRGRPRPASVHGWRCSSAKMGQPGRQSPAPIVSQETVQFVIMPDYPIEGNPRQRLKGFQSSHHHGGSRDGFFSSFGRRAPVGGVHLPKMFFARSSYASGRLYASQSSATLHAWLDIFAAKDRLTSCSTLLLDPRL